MSRVHNTLLVAIRFFSFSKTGKTVANISRTFCGKLAKLKLICYYLQDLIPLYYTLISSYPHTLIPLYTYTLYTLIPLYPCTLIPLYTYTLIPLCLYTLTPFFVVFLFVSRCFSLFSLFSCFFVLRWQPFFWGCHLCCFVSPFS